MAQRSQLGRHAVVLLVVLLVDLHAGRKSGGIVILPFFLEELTNRMALLQQENKVLKIELETYKLKCKALLENRDLCKVSVTIQARAEQEEEFISNTLLKIVQSLPEGEGNPCCKLSEGRTVPH